VVIGAGIYLVLTRKGGRDPEPLPGESAVASADAEAWIDDSAGDPVDEWSAIDAELELSSPASDHTPDDTSGDTADDRSD
jgi:hypothetical protein